LGIQNKKNQFYFTHFYSFPVFIMSSLLPNKRSILFVGFRRKNNGQMIMDKYRKSLKMGEEKLKKISITKNY